MRPMSSGGSAPTTSTASRTRRGQGLLLQVGARHLARGRRGDLRAQGRARVDAEVPAQELDYFLARPMPSWGADLSGIDFENIYYYIRPTEKQAESWEDLPAESRTRGTSSGSRRRRRSTSPGWVQYESEVVYHKLQADLEAKGVIFLDMDSGLREHEARQAVLRDDHPAERQQVRGAQLGRLVGRLVHLRAPGRQGRDAAPGLLPHQRGEHGPVRAHADHRRRGRLRALRRGLRRPSTRPTRCTRRSSRSSSSAEAATGTRRSRTGRTTSTTSSRSARSPTRTRRWSGSTGTSARR